MSGKLVRIAKALLAPHRLGIPPQTGAGTKRIALITKGSFSHANAEIHAALTREFHGREIDRIDIADILQARPGVWARNIASTLATFPRELISRRRSFRECFYLTPFLFRSIRGLMPEIIRPGLYEFSIQTQSILDFSVPGVPHYIYSDHTHLTNLQYPAFDRRDLLPGWWVDLERSIYSNARKVFVMTQHVRKTLLEHYGCEPSKAICIHAGGNVEFMEELPPVKRQQRVLFVGVNWRRKGGPQLLEAFLSIAGEFPKAKLVVVGCNPPVAHPQVEILGRVPLQSVREEYLKAQIFAFPTRIEPTGFVVVEAMSYQLPVVGTPVGIMPDLVRNGENGFLAQPDDIQGLASALRELLADPEKCRRFGEIGRETVRRDYNWEAVGAALRREIAGSLGER